MVLSKAVSGSRFIPSEEVGSAVSWSFSAMAPALGDSGLSAETRWKAREEAEQARQAAYDEGFDAGLATGREMASRETAQFLRTTGKQAADQLAHVVARLEQELGDSRQAMASGLLELACEIARQVVRSELQTRREVVVPVIDEALALMAQDALPHTVRLNPQDLELVREEFEHRSDRRQIAWRADPAITPGGCTVEAAGALVDGSVEARWTRAVAGLGLSSIWKD